MNTKWLQVSHSQGIAKLMLNRPEKRNAMNGEMTRELLQVLRELANDEQLRVLIIHGNGEHFCAGADIFWMQEVASGSYNENYDDAQLLADVMYQLYTFPKPTIALVHGAAMGGGLGLAVAADMAIAAKNASFALSEVKIGVVPAIISPYVIAAIGERNAHYYFLTAEKFDAEDAKRIGLIHQVTENDALMTTGLSLAQSLLTCSPAALTAAKQLIRQIAKEKITTGLVQKTAEFLANLRSGQEAQEGLRAFMEKRAPKWCEQNK